MKLILMRVFENENSRHALIGGDGIWAMLKIQKEFVGLDFLVSEQDRTTIFKESFSRRQCSPVVIPFDQSSLYIKWENVFQDCHGSVVDKVTVSLDMVDTEIKFNQKSVVLKGDPCEKHEVEITLDFKPEYGEEHGRTFLSSRIREYNKFNNKSSESELYNAYGGLFKEQFVENICLNDNLTVIIPEPPKSFEKCIKTHAGVHNISVGGTILIEIVDPTKQGSFDKSFPLLTSFEECTNRTETETLATNANDDSFQKLLLTISVPLFVAMLLVLMALLLQKKCSTKRTRRWTRRGQRTISIDENPTFGEYYYDGPDRFSFLLSCTTLTTIYMIY